MGFRKDIFEITVKAHREFGKGSLRDGSQRAFDRPAMRSVMNAGTGADNEGATPSGSFHLSLEHEAKASPLEAIVSAALGKAPRDASPAAQRMKGLDLTGSLGRTEAAFGTIGTSAFERAAFWDIVDELERKPQTSGVMLDVVLDPSDNATWWLHALADGNPPSVLREWLTSGSATPLHMILTEQAALEVIQWARSLVTERGKGPVKVKIPEGRGGRVQTWLVASLPYELTPEGRRRVVEGFTATLQEEGYPYWAALCRPDVEAGSDKRHYHAQVLWYERPARRMIHPETGREVWDFEVVVEGRDKSRHIVERRPFLQKRNRVFASYGYPRILRALWARLMNEELVREGREPTRDARSFRDMGSALSPLPSITAGHLARERKGIATPSGVLRARAEWDRYEAQVEQDTDAERDAELSAFRARMTRGCEDLYAHPDANVEIIDAIGVAGLQLAGLIRERWARVAARRALAVIVARFVSRPRLAVHAGTATDEDMQLIAAAEAFEAKLAPDTTPTSEETELDALLRQVTNGGPREWQARTRDWDQTRALGDHEPGRDAP